LAETEEARPRDVLLEVLSREGRRLGSASTIHNQACADLVGLNSSDWECLDVLDWTGSITAGHLAEHVGLTSGAITGVIDRLEKAAKPAEEGKKLCIELIEQVREVKGVAGVHIMAYRREHLVQEIIEDSGLLKERLEAKARDRLSE